MAFGQDAGEVGHGRKARLQHVRDLVRHQLQRRVGPVQQHVGAMRRAGGAQCIQQGVRGRPGVRLHRLQRAAEALLQLVAVGQFDGFAGGLRPGLVQRRGRVVEMLHQAGPLRKGAARGRGRRAQRLRAGRRAPRAGGWAAGAVLHRQAA